MQLLIFQVICPPVPVAHKRIPVTQMKTLIVCEKGDKGENSGNTAVQFLFRSHIIRPLEYVMSQTPGARLKNSFGAPVCGSMPTPGLYHQLDVVRLKSVSLTCLIAICMVVSAQPTP